MNRENNAAIQQSEKRPDQEPSSGTFETRRESATVKKAGETTGEMLARSLQAVRREDETLGRLDLLNAELDVENDPKDVESQSRLAALRAKAEESVSRRAVEVAKVKPEDMEKFSPLLEAINAEVDANAELRAAEAAERAAIIAELQAEAARDRAEKAQQAMIVAEMVKATEASKLDEQKEAILKTLERINAEGAPYRHKQQTVRADVDYAPHSVEQIEALEEKSMGTLDKVNADVDARQAAIEAKAAQWDEKRRAAIGRTEAPRKEAPKPPELTPEQRAERAAERAKALAERVDEAMRKNDEARAAWDKTATELDQAFWLESTDDKVTMPILDRINAKLDAEAEAEYGRTLGVIDEIDESLDKTDSIELKRKVAKLRAVLAVPKPPQNIERQVRRALEEARAVRYRKQVESLKAEEAKDRQKHLEEAFGSGWTPEELGIFERGQYDAAAPADSGYETEKDGGKEYLVKRRTEEVGRIIAENALTPERRLETASRIGELERKGQELKDKYKLEETKLNHILGMSIEEAKALEFASDKKSVLSRLAIGFRKLFTKDVLGEQEKAYNDALLAYQENEEKVADLKKILENPQEATDVAAIRFVQRLRRSGTGGRLPTIHI